MSPDLKNTLDAQNPGSSQSVQFEDEGAGGSTHSFNNYTQAGNVVSNGPQNTLNNSYNVMPRQKKIPFLFRILIQWHIAKDVKHAQKIAVGFAIVMALVAVYYIQKAMTPGHVVPIRLRRIK